MKALEQRRVTEARWRLLAGESWGDSGLVLTTLLGDAIDPRNFHRYFKARAETAGVPVISVHATRRTCASLLVALDVHPRVAMAILRLSKIAVTMDIYSQVSSASTRSALKRLGSQLGEGSACPPVAGPFWGTKAKEAASDVWKVASDLSGA